MRNMGTSIGVLVLLVVAVWGIGQVAGFEVSLWGTLALSVGLTIVLNVILALVRGRR
ncbi:MAG: hypothetical protein ACOCXM_03985 [Myxococcota bacterium]